MLQIESDQEKQQELLTLKETMDYLRVSRSTLHRLMAQGELTGHKVGSTWRFFPSDVRSCIKKSQSSEGGANNA